MDIMGTRKVRYIERYQLREPAPETMSTTILKDLILFLRGGIPSVLPVFTSELSMPMSKEEELATNILE